MDKIDIAFDPVCKAAADALLAGAAPSGQYATIGRRPYRVDI
jgi:hypothetical protein